MFQIVQKNSCNCEVYRSEVYNPEFWCEGDALIDELDDAYTIILSVGDTITIEHVENV